MGIFMLWATWAHEYMDIFINIDGHRMRGRLKELFLVFLSSGKTLTWPPMQFCTVV